MDKILDVIMITLFILICLIKIKCVYTMIMIKHELELE